MVGKEGDSESYRDQSRLNASNFNRFSMNVDAATGENRLCTSSRTIYSEEEAAAHRANETSCGGDFNQDESDSPIDLYPWY